jgi:hypothetical protein
MRFASNTQISTPVAINVRPDVDLNGMMWSYTAGLMFPAQAAVAMNQLPQPYPATLSQPASPTGGLH